MAVSDHRIATGHGVALGSLTNVEDISQFQYQGVGLYPTSPIIDPYPVRTRVLSTKEYGDGAIPHEWFWNLLPQVAVEYIYDTYMSGGTVVTNNATIYTPRFDYDDWVRYNAYIYRFRGDDIGYKGLDEFGTKICENVRLRMTLIAAL